MTKAKKVLPKIVFHESAKEFLIETFGKKLNEEGFIVDDTDESQLVLTEEGEPIHIKDFAGVKHGSDIFLKNDLPSMFDLSRSIAR